MDNFEKENKRLKVLVVILLLILLGFGGFYFYTTYVKGDKTAMDNKVNDSEVKDNTSNEENNNVEVENLKVDEIREIFSFVYSYYELPEVYCGKSDHTFVNIYGVDRYTSTEFSTYEEMINSLKKYMSIEVIAGKTPFASTTKEYYLEKDGKLYCEVTYKGFLESFGNIEIEITSQTENSITCIATMELIDPSSNKTYDKVNLSLEKKDGNWIVTSYIKQD